MTRPQALFLALTAGLSGGCATPVYQLPATDALAQVRFVNVQDPVICVGKEAHLLSAEANGYATVPAGRPIHFVATFRRDGGTCHLAATFAPQPGQRYQVINEARDEQCFPTVMREDRSAQLGLRLEPTAAPAPTACKLGPGY